MEIDNAFEDAVPLREGRDRAAIAETLGIKVEALTSPRKKHARLQAAILSAVADALLAPGDQLPPEPELARATGMSLGTVRRCLTRMAAEGLVTREHGRGTFIAAQVPAIHDIWHVRFFAEDGKTQLPMFHRLMHRGIVDGDADITGALGPTESGYMKITRICNIDSRFVTYSEFYLSADRFGALLDAPADDIEAQGTKHYLASAYDTRIIRIDKTVCMIPVPGDVAEIIGLGTGATAMHLRVKGYGTGNLPLSYQSIWIPPTDVPLDVSAGP